MSITDPQINELLDKAQQNPFLLCTMASKRATDINNMLRGQHLRVTSGAIPSSPHRCAIARMLSDCSQSGLKKTRRTSSGRIFSSSNVSVAPSV